MVSLTQTGESFFSKIAEDHRDWVGTMMANLTSDEMKTLYVLLARLKESILDAEQKNNMKAAE
jgi:DNA-binding MarR family transcriptional regulator